MNEKQTTRCVKKWRDKLYLGEWEINVTFEDIKAPDNSEYFRADAKSEVKSEYLTSHITFQKGQDVLEETVVHELVHILTSEMFGYCLANDPRANEKENWTDYFNERLVTRITRFLMDSRTKGDKI